MVSSTCEDFICQQDERALKREIRHLREQNAHLEKWLKEQADIVKRLKERLEADVATAEARGYQRGFDTADEHWSAAKFRLERQLAAQERIANKHIALINQLREELKAHDKTPIPLAETDAW